MRAATIHVNAARRLAAKGQLAGAVHEADAAAARARHAMRLTNGLPFRVVRPLPVLGAQARAAGMLTASAADLTRRGSHLLRAVDGTAVAHQHSLGLGVGALGSLAEQLGPVRGPLATMSASVDKSLDTANELQRASLIPPLRRATEQLSDALGAVARQLRAAHAADVFVARAAEPGPPLRLLFLAQDTWELRPSGGFIGSYGILEVGNGTLHLSQYADATNLPDPVTPMRPPDPLGSNLPHVWDLTGAGWWPDFPTSAQAAEALFRSQGGGEVDGVVGSTQQFIEDLLRAIGEPMPVPGFPDVVGPGNVAERILYNVELKRPSDEPRKKFLTALSQELFRRLERLEGADARAKRLAPSARHSPPVTCRCISTMHRCGNRSPTRVGPVP